METLLNLPPPPPPPQKGSLYAVRRASESERRDIIIFQFVQAVSSVFSLNTDPIEAQGPPRYPSPSV